MSDDNADQPAHDKQTLPVIADCNGCGVCCFHMGYPAYRLPQAPLTDEQIDSDPELFRQATKSERRRKELNQGSSGEPHWHSMPMELKTEWQAFVDDYQIPDYGSDPKSFDGPCTWFDMTTRQCKHHEYRPQICREFETGCTQCLEWRLYYADKILPN